MICTDSAKQYQGVDKMFSDRSVHFSTNYNKKKLKDNPQNTINNLENQNKLLKKSIVCRRTPKLLYEYIALYFHSKYVLAKNYAHDIRLQVMTFIEDIVKGYPGYVIFRKSRAYS